MKIPAFLNHPWVRRCTWALAGLLLLWCLSWLAVGPLLRSQGEKIASEKLGRTVSIGEIEFRPWSLELSIHDLQIASATAGPPQLEIKRIYIDAELQSLLRWAPVVDALEIDSPVLRLTQQAPGRYDLDDVVARLSSPAPEPATPSATPPGFALYNLALQGGRIEFIDRTVERTHRLDELTLRVPFLSNLASQRAVKVRPYLAFVLNDSRFESEAEATPFADNRQTQATLRLQGLDLAPYLGYLPSSLPVRLQSAVLDADVRLSFLQNPETAIQLSGQWGVRNLQLSDAQQRPLLSLAALQVKITDLQPLKRLAKLESLELQGPHITAQRNKAGQINWAQLAAPNPKSQRKNSDTTAPTPSNTQTAPWQVSVAQVAMRDGQVAWQDDSLPTPARLALQGLRLDASDIALPLTQPLRFSGHSQIVSHNPPATAPAPATAAAGFSFAGQTTTQQGQLALSIHQLPLQLAAPYIAALASPRLAGVLHSDLGVAWNHPKLVAHIANLRIDNVELTCAAPSTDCTPANQAGLTMRGQDTLAELKKLAIDNAQIDLTRQSVQIGRFALTQPRLLVERDTRGQWMFERWLNTASTSASTTSTARTPAPSKPWTVRFNELALDGGAVALRDNLPAQPVALQVSALQVHLQDFAPLSTHTKPGPLSLSARIGAGRADPGRLQYEGSLGLSPLSAQGKVQALQLPLHALEPYVAQALNVDIRRADGNFQGQVRYQQTSAGPELQVQGDAGLDDVRVRVAESSRGLGSREDLLSWKSLAVRGLDIALLPGKPLSVDVRETVLNDFFARIVLQESGRLNLQDVLKTPPATSGPTSADASASPAPAAPATPAAAPLIRVGPVALNHGKVYFSDNFIQPNYSANLSELQGRLSAFSSLAPANGTAPNMAELTLRGRAEGTASLEITGKLNPLAKPLALDIQAKMRDLELPPLSPYTVKYAGHGIERGKLSMDVAYQVQPNGQLTASNKLILNQLAFGDPVEGAPTSLPVRLAVALLADRNGVIDVDLPISGSLNDPEFRLGAVIFKVIGNLVMKAITAPFSLLANAFSGGGNSADTVSFAPGSAHLDERARQQLDQVAKAMNERPALTMTVAGQASTEVERDAWRQARLQQALLAQKRGNQARSASPTEASATASVSAEEYPALLKALYRRSDIAKPRNLVGMAKDLPLADMEALLLESIAVPDNAMRDLAVARGVAVRDYLASRGLALERLFLGAAKNVPPEASWQPQAQLTLATR